MNIVISGASGFVGRQLVPLLQQQGVELLLLGRDRSQLTRLYPGVRTAEYDTWEDTAQGWDLFLHLATLNNDQPYSDAQFQAVNVELTLSIARQAARAGIRRFVNVSSMHALDPADTSGYARSKRDAARALESIETIPTSTLYLPLVYGRAWAGKLSILNHLPAGLASALFQPLSALKPTVHVRRLAEYLLRPAEDEEDSIISDRQENNAWYGLFTLLINWGFALFVFVFLWWLLLLIWAAVRFNSPGPGIFAQQRLGQRGQPFTCYKFRTMKAGTRQAGTHEVSQASVTRIGEFLRKTKLDELPQCWNILRGDLLLVGPRPGLPVQQELAQARQRHRVFDVKPGITGWAQIHEIDMSTPDELARWDAEYIAMRGIVLDLRIIFSTALGRGQGDRTVTSGGASEET